MVTVDLGIEDRVALVLGASRGLGLASAEALGREGVKVALASRSEDDLERLAVEIGNGAGAFAVDTADAAAVDDLPGRVAEAMGPIEILVLNTGGPPPGGRSRPPTRIGRLRSARSC